MNFFLISSRATPNFTFILQFTVSHGPPSKIICTYNGINFLGEFQSREYFLGRKVIRSHYINNSYPDMTRVSVTHTSPREPRTYTCTVTAEGRVNIHNASSYDFDPKGSGTTTVSTTGECVTACCTQLHCSLLLLLLLLLLLSVAGTPTGVTANRTGYNSASVSWTAPSTGTPPAGYEVFYQLTGGCIVSGGNTSNTELTLTGLTLGNYSIFVVGYGAEGDPVLPSTRSETTSIIIG